MEDSPSERRSSWSAEPNEEKSGDGGCRGKGFLLVLKHGQKKVGLAANAAFEGCAKAKGKLTDTKYLI